MSDDEKIIKKTWTCPECKNCFVKYMSFYSHRRVKHRPPVVDCVHCDEKFATYAARNSHYYHAIFGERSKQRKKRARPAESSSSSSSSDSSYEEGQTSETQSD